MEKLMNSDPQFIQISDLNNSKQRVKTPIDLHTYFAKCMIPHTYRYKRSRTLQAFRNQHHRCFCPKLGLYTHAIQNLYTNYYIMSSCSLIRSVRKPINFKKRDATYLDLNHQIYLRSPTNTTIYAIPSDTIPVK